MWAIGYAKLAFKRQIRNPPNAALKHLSLEVGRQSKPPESSNRGRKPKDDLRETFGDSLRVATHADQGGRR